MSTLRAAVGDLTFSSSWDGDVAYNENHTTVTLQLFEMTSSEKMTVNPEHLRGNDGTVRNALELWSSRNGPIGYNPWVSLYWSLLRDHGLTDQGGNYEAVRKEMDRQDRARRIQQYYTEIHEEVHGPDFKAQAILARDRARRTPT